MGSSRMSRRLAGLVAFACIAGTAAPALAGADPGTGFTYQGSLSQNGSPVTGLRDMRFRLYDAATGGTPIETVQAFDVDISGGLFSVEVDFGAGPWTANEQLWVEIEAGPADQSQSYEVIGRQKLTATPYALNTRGIAVEANNNITIGATLSLENPAESTWSVFSGSQGRFGIQDTTGPNTRFLIDSVGKVGIGTTSPEGGLSVTAGLVDASPTQNGVHLGLSGADEGVIEFTAPEGGRGIIDFNAGAETGRFQYRGSDDTFGFFNADFLVNQDLTVVGKTTVDEASIQTLKAFKGAVGLFASGREDTELQIVRDTNRVGLRVERGAFQGDAEAAIFEGDIRANGNVDLDKIRSNFRNGTNFRERLTIESGGLFLPSQVAVGEFLGDFVMVDINGFEGASAIQFSPVGNPFVDVFEVEDDGRLLQRTSSGSTVVTMGNNFTSTTDGLVSNGTRISTEKAEHPPRSDRGPRHRGRPCRPLCSTERRSSSSPVTRSSRRRTAPGSRSRTTATTRGCRSPRSAGSASPRSGRPTRATRTSSSP
jgi:hypothetical protein